MTLILTLRLDAESQAFFDRMRLAHSSPERNFLKAHLTLFHQLPDNESTIVGLTGLNIAPCDLQVTGLINLGGRVDYRVESQSLIYFHRRLSAYFADVLIPQDRQGFWPHIVVQNKVLPAGPKR